MRGAPAPTSTDAYLAAVPPDQRAALQALRETVLAVVPDAVECISYGMPAFRLNGRAFCYFAAARRHCAFYPGGQVEDFAAELTDFSTSKGAIRFQPDRPMPPDLLRRIILRCVERAAARGG